MPCRRVFFLTPAQITVDNERTNIQGDGQREAVLLVLFFMVGCVLYGVGLPLTWVIALPLIAALAVDFILLQPKRSGTAVEKMRDPIKTSEYNRQ